MPAETTLSRRALLRTTGLLAGGLACGGLPAARARAGFSISSIAAQWPTVTTLLDGLVPARLLSGRIRHWRQPGW